MLHQTTTCVWVNLISVAWCFVQCDFFFCQSLPKAMAAIIRQLSSYMKLAMMLTSLVSVTSQWPTSWVSTWSKDPQGCFMPIRCHMAFIQLMLHNQPDIAASKPRLWYPENPSLLYIFLVILGDTDCIWFLIWPCFEIDSSLLVIHISKYSLLTHWHLVTPYASATHLKIGKPWIWSTSAWSSNELHLLQWLDLKKGYQ